MTTIDIVNEHNERLTELENSIVSLRVAVGFLLLAVLGLLVKVPG